MFIIRRGGSGEIGQRSSRRRAGINCRESFRRRRGCRERARRSSAPSHPSPPHPTLPDPRWRPFHFKWSRSARAYDGGVLSFGLLPHDASQRAHSGSVTSHHASVTSCDAPGRISRSERADTLQVGKKSMTSKIYNRNIYLGLCVRSKVVLQAFWDRKVL